MSSALQNIIQHERIEHVYQPLWNLNNWSIFGFESLLRFPEEYSCRNIEEAFEQARTEGLLYELDTLSISHAVSNFPLDLSGEELLFINVFPSTLLHEDLEIFIEQLVTKYPTIIGNIVFELNETKHEKHIWKIPHLKKRIAFLKEKGFFVALDDFGKEESTFQKIIEFTPNCIKLDRYFSKDLSSSKKKQRVVSLLVEYSKGRMVVVLEGLEKEMDLAMAKILKVPVAQGYLLGKPQKLTENSFTNDLFNSLRKHGRTYKSLINFSER
ncbi:EAL domain-containing protein [Robertmurraya massiliosenegalensis]|uniref:EAL domain-containing protein n=1 Tax=Robertmurraya TaxID=2837507 RepID=UPI0039A6C0AE